MVTYMTTGFQWIDLASLTEGRPFDGMAFGKFVDMLGREVELNADDRDDYITNTQAAINETQTESGELVGLPIDAGNHDKGDAAGWIVGVELAGDIIRLIPKWTKIGLELIGEGLRRYFSPTVDVNNKTILGGALVNWPATHDSKGRVLLRPIELSSSIHSIHEVGDMSEKTEVVEEVLAATPDDVQPEQAAIEEPTADAVAELTQQIREDERARWQAHYQAQLAQEREQAHIAEFAQKMQAAGLVIGYEEIEAFLGSLNTAQREGAESILTRIVEGGLVQFNELGHSKRLDRETVELSGFLANTLRQFVADGGTPEEWFRINPELGDMNRYDLSAYEEAK
jgi:hypothetical protein